MIYLHTLGDTLIKVGEKEIRPTAPLLFAALLYLGMERGRRVSRAALQELLFPEADERSGAHSLRQLLYKLRQLGAPIESDQATVALPISAIEEEIIRPGDVGNDSRYLDRLSLGLLPGYQPSLSETFERWLEVVRANAATGIRSRLLLELSRTRGAGDHARVHRIATALLRLDPLNEEATLACAEVLALTGQKREAVRLLEDYSNEVGATSPQLRLPSDLLRRRIAERFSGSEHSQIPLFGRQDELAWLLAQFGRAVGSVPTVSILWGEAGIGKTRLAHEFTSHLLFRRARVESAHCQPHDVDRPLGALIDLVPKLLQARGALGVPPAALEILRRLSGETQPAGPSLSLDPEQVSARIRTALTELLVSVASEGPLVLLVEDAHWLDQASFRLLLRTVPAQNARLHLVLTLRSRMKFAAEASLSDSVFVRRLEPLRHLAAIELFEHLIGSGCSASDSIREQCLALAAGNPLFLRSIAEHLRLRGDAPPTSAGLADLLRQRIGILESRALLLLRCVAALGNHGTQPRLSACTGMTDGMGLLALQELADRGLVIRQDGAIKCSHDLLADVVLSEAPSPIRVALFERAATVLEEDGSARKQVNLLWSCAERWRLAENRGRAIRVLQRCAEFSLEIGQPIFACSALERAQELSDDSQPLPLVEETIRIAAMASAHSTLIESIDRYKGLLRAAGKSLPRHHPYKMMEIQGIWASGGSVWHLRDELRRCALDADAPVSYRLKAARTFFLEASKYLAKSEALALYSALDELHVAASNSFEYLELKLHFHMLFGDMQQARVEAEEFLVIARTREDFSRAILANAALALFRSGATNAALEVLREAESLNESLGLKDLQTLNCAQLASFYLYLGDISNAQTWHDRAEKYLTQCDDRYTAFQITNRIDFALRGNNSACAHRELKMLRSYREAATPHAVRTIRGYEILVAHLDGTLDPASLDFRALEHTDDLGRESIEHHVFALALFVAYDSCGMYSEAVSRLRDYVFIWRRERYPLWPYFQGLAANGELLERLRVALGTEATLTSNAA